LILRVNWRAISCYEKGLGSRLKTLIHITAWAWLLQEGDIEKAARHFSEAIRIKPELEELTI
jgi:hypothetical protein